MAENKNININRTSQTLVKTKNGTTNNISNVNGSGSGYCSLVGLTMKNLIPAAANAQAYRWRTTAIIVTVIGVLLLAGIITVCVIFTRPPDKNGNTEESKIATTPLAIPAGSSSTPVVQQTCSPECAPSLGCTVDNDPSTCEGCLHARVKAGIFEFCVSSCKDVGSTVKEQRDGVDYCNDLSLENVALTSLGASCHASSEHSQEWVCENALDGGDAQWSPYADGAGVWIEVTLDKEYVASGLEITGRSAKFSQCKIYDLSFDGSVSHRIDWECTEGRTTRDYFFPPTKLQTLRITCKVDCGVGGAQGFRNLQIWALKPKL